MNWAFGYEVVLERGISIMERQPDTVTGIWVANLHLEILHSR